MIRNIDQQIKDLEMKRKELDQQSYALSRHDKADDLEALAYLIDGRSVKLDSYGKTRQGF
jgi:hypothetical protein